MPRPLPPLLSTTAWTLISVAVAALAVELSLVIFAPSSPLITMIARLFAFVFTLFHGLRQCQQRPLAVLGLISLASGVYSLVILAFHFTLQPVPIILGFLILGVGLILSQVERPSPITPGADHDG